MIHVTRLACFALALAPAPSVFAQDQPARTTQPAPASKPNPKDDMSGMSMDQMMAHCAQMRADMKAGKPMSPEMHRMMQQCDQMDGQMEMPSGTKDR